MQDELSKLLKQRAVGKADPYEAETEARRLRFANDFGKVQAPVAAAPKPAPAPAAPVNPPGFIPPPPPPPPPAAAPLSGKEALAKHKEQLAKDKEGLDKQTENSPAQIKPRAVRPQGPSQAYKDELVQKLKKRKEGMSDADEAAAEERRLRFANDYDENPVDEPAPEPAPAPAAPVNPPGFIPPPPPPPPLSRAAGPGAGKAGAGEQKNTSDDQ